MERDDENDGVEPGQELAPPPEPPPEFIETTVCSDDEKKLPLGLTKERLAVAFAIAGISDALSAFTAFAPPLDWVVDFITAVLLFIVLGWHWMLLPGLVMEAMPGVGVFPFWVLVVGAIAVWGTTKPKFN